MPTPRSHADTFTIGDTSFYYYFAQDAHGTQLRTYRVNNQSVTRSQFYGTMRTVLKPMEQHVLIALGAATFYNPEWTT